MVAKILFNAKAYGHAFTCTHRHTHYTYIPVQNINPVSAMPLWIDEQRILIPVRTNTGTGVLVAR